MGQVKTKKKRGRWDRPTESPERLPALGPIRENRNIKGTIPKRSRSKSPTNTIEENGENNEEEDSGKKSSAKRKKTKEKEKRRKSRSSSPPPPPPPPPQEDEDREAILRQRALHSLKKRN